MRNKQNIIYGSPGIVTLPDAMRKFLGDQLSVWPLARRNVRSLKHIRTKKLQLHSLEVEVQYNPARAISSKAPLDEESIAARACFLCRDNRPPEQMHMEFEGAKGKRYDILVNPFPILEEHFIVSSREHVPQSISHRYVDMLRLSKRACGFTFLYNGPVSGASAPDHFHFQAVPSGVLPLEVQARSAAAPLRLLASVRDASIYLMESYAEGVFVIRSRSSKSASKLFYRLLDCAGVKDGETEPRINVFSTRDGGEYLSIVVMRSCHRPACYFSDDPAEHFSMSPGCVDMGGVFITVEKGDFERLDSDRLAAMLREVTLSHEQVERICRRLTRCQPLLQAEILRAPQIEFEVLSYGAGHRLATLREGRVEYGGMLYDEIVFDEKVSSTMFPEPSFTVYGAGGAQSYAGGLKIVAEGDCLVAYNLIGVEFYILAAMSAKEDCPHSVSSLNSDSPEDSLVDRIVALRTGLFEPRDGVLEALPCPIGQNDVLKEAIDDSWGLVHLSKNI